ncbi:probable galacturonosyltransferase 7 isoform X1 [Asparagus officinalis]|nr:probable galacturonosyltransferase 7 isoform X1 [Asparagus officinalis]
MEEGDENQKEEDKRINELVDKFKPTLPQEVISTGKGEVAFHKDNKNPTDSKGEFISQPKHTSHTKQGEVNSKGPPRSHSVSSEATSVPNPKDGRKAGKNTPKGSNGDATQKSCLLEFGSYCLWSKEHKEVMKDSVVKRLKDQVFVARAYYPTIAKLKGQEKLSREMKQNIQDHERMLSEAISDPDLPSFVQKKIERMDRTIAKAKTCPVDCNNVDKKLRQILDLTEDEAHFHMKQSAFLHHLGVQTMPKSHHCLSMRLTVEYFRAPPADIEQAHAHKLDNPSYRQYIIFSRNVLAASVTINSTVMCSKKTGNMVFNVLTDEENFYTMKLWFSRQSYKAAVVHVMNMKDFKLNSYSSGLPQLSSSEEFRISILTNDESSPAQMRTEFTSVFGHSHFLIPEIFKNLKKVVVLDDDVVVQRDLSSLWDIDLHGKVNGAVKFCKVKLGQLKSYMGNHQYRDSCSWMSGLNVIDLEKWRELKITGKHQQALPKFHNGSEASWRAAALPTSLLAFQNQIFPLDDSWVLSGLGYDYRIDADAIKNAGILHYNGNMKPWLDLGIPKYRKYWKKFLTHGDQFMDQCNINH